MTKAECKQTCQEHEPCEEIENQTQPTLIDYALLYWLLGSILDGGGLDDDSFEDSEEE